MISKYFPTSLFLSKSIVFYLGCLICYTLQVEGHYSAVFSAAFVGFIGSFLHFPKLYEKKGLHAAIYAGAFAGMGSTEILTSHWDILIVSLIGTFFYVISRPIAFGFGGKMGTISFVSSFCFYVIRKFL